MTRTTLQRLKALNYFLSKDLQFNSHQAQFMLEGTRFCLKQNYFSFHDKFYLKTRGASMRVTFAPCYANIMKGWWEELTIWNNNPYERHIVFYGRYIDDMLIIWDVNGFLAFVATLMIWASPSCTSSTPNHLMFLDLELTHDIESIVTINHSKLVSGNSYLHDGSCHHPTWKRNIPKGQFLRLQRNCTRDTDYIVQSKVLFEKS